MTFTTDAIVATLRNEIEKEIKTPGLHKFTCSGGELCYKGEFSEPYWIVADASKSFEASDEFVDKVLNDHLKLNGYKIDKTLESALSPFNRK
jgi:hypothetical protein